MNIRISIVVVLLTFSTTSFAQQGFDDVLSEVERNNTELAAYQQLTNAKKLEAKTGIYLQNPEVDGAYLWGAPSAIGNRQDFSVMQPFDFPSAYKHRSKLADALGTQADYTYFQKRWSVLLEADQLCVSLVYLNRLSAELQRRVSNAESLAKAYNLAFEKGEVNILDRNKANLSLLNAQQDLALVTADRNNLLQQLQTLNGEKSIAFVEQGYRVVSIPNNFDEWYTAVEGKNPELLLADSEVKVADRQVSLSKSLTLPKFSAGYMLENVVGQRYQGVKLSLSIPLWENKNTVKQAKAQSLAAQSTLNSAKQTLKGRLKAQYDKAVSLRKAVERYQQSMSLLNNTDLLKKALDKGQLSLVEYVMELQLYYDAINKMLEDEHNLQLVLSELRVWEF